ncbi:hypothetical protein H0A73_15320 [Alcaligenaceae bacterium]|nr:hypothetical protein [Alcaligenaceae bacterium]
MIKNPSAIFFLRDRPGLAAFPHDDVEEGGCPSEHRGVGESLPQARGEGAGPRQLSLALDRWPAPVAGGLYDRAAAHRQAFEQRCLGGRVAIELWVLEVVPDLYIQACEVQVGELRRSTPLRLSMRNRYHAPEAALRAAAQKAAREMKALGRASGTDAENRTVLLRAANWLDDILTHCAYLLERQVKLFG